MFTYNVEGRTIRVTREPGPKKVLKATPRALREFKADIVASNQWTPDSFLTRLSIFSYVGGLPTSLSSGVLKQYYQERREEQSLTDDEVLYWVEYKFGTDPQIYREAQRLHRKWMEYSGL